MAAALPKASELKERGPDGKLQRFITQLISTVICHYRSGIPLVPETKPSVWEGLHGDVDFPKCRFGGTIIEVAEQTKIFLL